MTVFSLRDIGLYRLTALAVCVLSTASPAAAAGVEDTVAGTIALGRSANYVHVSDFMATWQNPANLAVIPGADLGGELRLPILSACFDRAKDPSIQYREPDASTGFGGSESFAKVCNKGSLLPAGNIGWAQSFQLKASHSGWGYGIGLFTPAGVGKSKYGNATIVTLNPLPNEQLKITKAGVESPNRDLLLESNVLGAWLMAGAGYQPNKFVRFGLSVGAGFLTLAVKNTASVVGGRAASGTGGSFVDQEVLNDVHASDWFVPRATASVVVRPIDAVEVMGQVTYQDDVKADGYLDLTANGIRGAPRKDCRVKDPGQPGTHCRSDDVGVTVPFPTWEATLGARYAKRRFHSLERVVDPMRDEVWDIELDAGWSQTSNVDAFRVDIADPAAPDARVAFSSDPTAAALYQPAQVAIPKRWKDTYSARLGGDYNVMPNFLAVRLGASYQSSAIRNGYMNIDAWPVQKIGLHVGATIALGRVRFSLAYAHLFYETINIPVGAGRVTEVVSQLPAQALPVNEGRYTAGLNVISGQTNISF